MEGLQKAYNSAVSQAHDSVSKLSSYAASIEKSKSANSSSEMASSSAFSADQSRFLLTRPPGKSLSVWTCSKLCAFCFVAGVVVGYTLKRRVRRWASKLLRRLKDD